MLFVLNGPCSTLGFTRKVSALVYVPLKIDSISSLTPRTLRSFCQPVTQIEIGIEQVMSLRDDIGIHRRQFAEQPVLGRQGDVICFKGMDQVLD